MTDREHSPAFQILPPTARRLLAVIETAIGSGSHADISSTHLRLVHYFGRATVGRMTTLLDRLGLIEVTPGPRLVNRFSLSNRWRSIDAVEAARLVVLAREPMAARRAASKPPQPKPVKRVKDKPQPAQRREPSLPPLPWQTGR